MENRTRQVAKSLWDLSDGDITNLRMQKLAYLAHVISLHKLDRPLITEGFEAWDYGPVCPSLYRRMKPYGPDKVANVFGRQGLDEDDEDLFDIVETTVNLCKDLRSSQLVGLTHISGGAWAQRYDPNTRGIGIPDALAKEDYNLIFIDE